MVRLVVVSTIYFCTARYPTFMDRWRGRSTGRLLDPNGPLYTRIFIRLHLRLGAAVLEPMLQE